MKLTLEQQKHLKDTLKKLINFHFKSESFQIWHGMLKIDTEGRNIATKDIIKSFMKVLKKELGEITNAEHNNT